MGVKDGNNEEIKDEEVDDTKAGNDAGGDSGTDSGAGDSSSSSSNEKMFTQSQVSKMMSNEKHQGKNAALRALGIDPNNKELVNSVKSFVASQKSDEDKNNEMLQQLATANALVEVMKAGVKPQYADDAVALAMSKSSRTGSSIEEAMSEYKQKYPEWFAPETDSSSESAGKGEKKDEEEGKAKFNGTGSTPPASGKKQTDNKQEGIGKRLAASRKKSTRKSSYWN